MLVLGVGGIGESASNVGGGTGETVEATLTGFGRPGRKDGKGKGRLDDERFCMLGDGSTSSARNFTGLSW